MVKGGEGEWKKIKIKRMTRKCIVNILKISKMKKVSPTENEGKKKKKKVNKYNNYTCEHDYWIVDISAIEISASPTPNLDNY